MKKKNFTPKRLFLFICCIFLVLSGCQKKFDTLTGPVEVYPDFEGQITNWAGAYAVIKPDRTLWMWGRNDTGHLGNGSLEHNFTPRQIKEIKQATAIHMRWGHVLAADTDGNIWYWGYNFARIYDDIVKRPIKLSKLKGVVQIDISFDRFRLLQNDGTVWQLEWSYKNPRQWLEPKQIQNFNNIIQISSSMLLTNDGVIYDVAPWDITQAINVSKLKHINDIKQVEDVFNRRTLVLKNDGTVWAWGKNYAGQNGDGTLIDRESPVKVLNLENVQKISANFDFNLAVRDDGTVWFWGFTGKKNGIITCQKIPLQIKELNDVTQVFTMSESFLKTIDGLYWTIDFCAQEEFIPYKVFEE